MGRKRGRFYVGTSAYLRGRGPRRPPRPPPEWVAPAEPALVKFSRYATHFKRLIGPHPPLRLFLGRARLLGGALGPILVQLPPHWRADPGRLDEFLEAAPRRHRWAVEFRDRSWLTEEVFAVLARHHAALCVHDLIPNHPWQLTTSWLYLRFHGSRSGRYAGSYSHATLMDRARSIRRQLARGIDVYAYFNNDLRGHAITNALGLRRYVDGRGGKRARRRPIST